MLPLQRAETDRSISVDFVLDGIWGPCVPLWDLQLPAGKESASGVKRLQGVKVKSE